MLITAKSTYPQTFDQNNDLVFWMNNSSEIGDWKTFSTSAIITQVFIIVCQTFTSRNRRCERELRDCNSIVGTVRKKEQGRVKMLHWLHIILIIKLYGDTCDREGRGWLEMCETDFNENERRSNIIRKRLTQQGWSISPVAFQISHSYILSEYNMVYISVIRQCTIQKIKVSDFYSTIISSKWKI